MAAAKEMSVNAAVLSELGGIFAFKEERRAAVKLSLCEDVFSL